MTNEILLDADKNHLSPRWRSNQRQENLASSEPDNDEIKFSETATSEYTLLSQNMLTYIMNSAAEWTESMSGKNINI